MESDHTDQLIRFLFLVFFVMIQPVLYIVLVIFPYLFFKDCIFSFLYTFLMKFFTATYQKAEVLYQMGRFEEALVFYHTGSKQRPDMELFHQGVRKAQEAIEVSLGGLILKYKIVGLI